jgi:hypothetical protein
VSSDPEQPPLWQRLADRFRDQTDLKTGLVSAAIGYLSMEILNQTIGPVPQAVFGLGAFIIAVVTLFGVVPRLRRGRW